MKRTEIEANARQPYANAILRLEQEKAELKNALTPIVRWLSAFKQVGNLDMGLVAHAEKILGEIRLVG